MGRYKRKTERQSWAEETMSGAIQAVLVGEMGYRRASKAYKVSQTTLERKVEKLNIRDCQTQENELVQHILTLEGRLSGLTLTDLRTLAFELAERNKISHAFNRQKKIAGKEWLYGFLSMHPRISLRGPEKTSMTPLKYRLMTCLYSRKGSPSLQHLHVKQRQMWSPRLQHLHVIQRQMWSPSLHHLHVMQYQMPQPCVPTFDISPKMLMLSPPPERDRLKRKKITREEVKLQYLRDPHINQNWKLKYRKGTNEKINKLKRNLSKTHKKHMHEVIPPRGRKAKKTKLEEPVLSSSEKEQDTETGMFCNELYLHSKAEEGWI
ncbi:hypothetical protein JTB14_026833 [Gonioctena quinquepunctata]|nr:hypothetical protein JTB14_026833 [Gonioctena quinquepunctata]